VTDRIREVIDRVIAAEGGYVDHPDDRGGPTHWGITQAVGREAGYDGDMRALPRRIAEQIYLEQYVLRPGFDLLAPPSISHWAIDTGVNMGVIAAGRILQRALNALNRDRRDYCDVTVDGLVGPQSRGALRAYLDHRGNEGERVLLHALNSLQLCRYVEIAEQNPTQEAFIYGWIRHRTGMENAQ